MLWRGAGGERCALPAGDAGPRWGGRRSRAGVGLLSEVRRPNFYIVRSFVEARPVMAQLRKGSAYAP